MSELISIAEYAQRHQKNRTVVFRLVQQGRIPAVQIGRQWCIEADAPYPADSRIKSGKYKDWRKPKDPTPAE